MHLHTCNSYCAILYFSIVDVQLELGSVHGTWGIVTVYSPKYRFLFLYITGDSLQMFARLLMSIEDCRQNMVGIFNSIYFWSFIFLFISFSQLSTISVRLLQTLENFRKEKIQKIRDDKKRFDRATDKYYRELQNHLSANAKKKDLFEVRGCCQHGLYKYGLNFSLSLSPPPSFPLLPCHSWGSLVWSSSSCGCKLFKKTLMMRAWSYLHQPFRTSHQGRRQRASL